MKVLCFALIGSVTVFASGYPAPAPGPLGASFTVFVPPPGVVDGFSIEQGGATQFEVGTAEIDYEIQMRSGFSGDELTM